MHKSDCVFGRSICVPEAPKPICMKIAQFVGYDLITEFIIYKYDAYDGQIFFVCTFRMYA